MPVDDDAVLEAREDRSRVERARGHRDQAGADVGRLVGVAPGAER